MIYTVTAADGTSSDYTVTVSVPLLNPAKSLTTFSINNVYGGEGAINEAEKSVVVTLLPSTNLSSLIAVFTTTGESVKVGDVVQGSGITANDFTNPVTYTVTAADTTTADYTVTVTAATGTSYTNNGNGTVTDNITGLMWQREDDNGWYNWTSALSLCSGLSLGGHSGWRLPTKDELVTIVDTSARPTIDTANFPGTNTDWAYWSATTYVGSTSYAWRVGFYAGHVYASSKSGSPYVRCVRGGQ